MKERDAAFDRIVDLSLQLRMMTNLLKRKACFGDSGLKALVEKADEVLDRSGPRSGE